MEFLNSRNIVSIETVRKNNSVMDGMFVFVFDTAYAFKIKC